MFKHPNETALLADLRTRELFAEVARERLADQTERRRPDRPQRTGWRGRLAALIATALGWLEPSGPPVRRGVVPNADAPSVIRAAATGPFGRSGRW